jgi:hypothetical protein
MVEPGTIAVMIGLATLIVERIFAYIHKVRKSKCMYESTDKQGKKRKGSLEIVS